MAVTKILVAQDDNETNQWLKVDSKTRYIVNDTQDWQFIFGPSTSLTTSTLFLKVAGEFNKDTFDTIRLAAYLYNPATGTVSNVSGITFNIYLVTTPTWTEQFISTVPGSQIYNNYYFADVNVSTLGLIDFSGGDTIMVEVVGNRLTDVYRERLYINHLGIYDNVTRLRQDVDYLDISKLDE